MIELRCEECGHSAQAPDSFRGRKVRCPRCRTLLRAPEVSEASLARPDDESRGSRAGSGLVANDTTSKRRVEVERAVRALLGDRPAAISSTAGGLEVRLKDARAGEARGIAQKVLSMPGVRDVRLLGGVGTALLSVALEGAPFMAGESFTDGEADTQRFRRAPVAAEPAAPAAPTFESEDSEPPVAHDEPVADDEKDTETYHGPAKPARAPRRLTDEDLTSLESLLARGQAHLDAGEPREAVAILERAVRIDRTWPEVVRVLADAYARLGEHDKARKAYRHLSRLEPDEAGAFVDHAAMAVECDKLDEALDALGRALRLTPEDPRVYRYAATVHERLGDREAARRMRARAEALRRPEAPARAAPKREALEGYALSPRVAALAAPVLERGDPEAYRRWLDHVALDPCYAPLETLERVERALEARDVPRATGLLQRLAATWLASPRYHSLRAEVAARRGNEPEAEQERRFAAQCLAAALGTGDGSRERPYFVAHASDEHDVIQRARPRGWPRGTEPPGEALAAAGKLVIERRRSRVLDVVALGSDSHGPDAFVAFDVTAPHAVLLRDTDLRPRERDPADRGARGPQGTDGGWLLPILGELERQGDEVLRSSGRKLANLVDSYPVPPDAKEGLLELVTTPQAPRFLDLRRRVLDGHFAALAAFDWAAVDERLRRERFKEALELLTDFVGLGLLSAPFHRLLGRARRGLGQGALAALELDLARRCTSWVELTGDGSEARPFVVACEPEEAELLSSRDLTAGEPHLHRRRDRAHRVHALEDGSRVWFDVSDSFREIYTSSPRGQDPEQDDASDGAQRLLWVRSWANARPGAAALESGELVPDTVRVAPGAAPHGGVARHRAPARVSPWASSPHQPVELQALLEGVGRVDPVWTRQGRELCDAVAPYHLALDMKRDFLRLALAPPQKDRYLALRQKLLENQWAAVAALDAKPLQELAQTKRYEELAERLRVQASVGLVTVHLHRFLSLALRETGREFLARTEYLLAHLARTWIQQTGDGSLERPYLVTCVRDEVELIEHMGFESERRETIERGGRVVDALIARGGRRLHFDITEPYRAAHA